MVSHCVYGRSVVELLLTLENIVMESYDTILLSSFYGYDSFNKKFGIQLANGKFTIPAEWQSALCEYWGCGTLTCSTRWIRRHHLRYPPKRSCC